MGSRFCSSPIRRQTRRPQPWTSTQVSSAVSPAAPPPIIILFSTCRGLRGFYKDFFSVLWIRIQPLILELPYGSGSILYYLSIFRNYFKKHLKFNKKKCCGVHPFWFVLAWRLVCKEYTKIFKRIMSLQKIQKSIFQFTCVTLKFYGSVPFNIVKGKKKKQVKPNMILSQTFL